MSPALLPDPPSLTGLNQGSWQDEDTMGQILSSTPRDQYTPKHEPQPTSSPNNGDFLREDMFGVLPEMMNGGTSAYQQFVVRTAGPTSCHIPRARPLSVEVPQAEYHVMLRKPCALWSCARNRVSLPPRLVPSRTSCSCPSGWRVYLLPSRPAVAVY